MGDILGGFAVVVVDNDAVFGGWLCCWERWSGDGVEAEAVMLDRRIGTSAVRRLVAAIR